MNDALRKRLDAIYDVRCPVCGAKASWHPTSTGFESMTCGHREVEDLIEARENSFPNLSDGEKKVKFKP